ncbi:uncharacterized protein [Aegilops tauschii subsp. strangulata]|uniref:uncharacterized protein n=1 Tax=Aegilops tauschii subsp. strangulata TaxID=200361 RepID=UPI003CC86010
MSIMAYCTKMKSFTDRLRDLGQPVTDSRQVFNLLRGLNQQFHSAIPHITSQVPLPSFLQVRSFVLLEEHRAEQSTTRQQSAHALVAGRGGSPTPPTPPPSNTNQGRGRGRRRRRGNGIGGPPTPSSQAPRPPPAYPTPAPGTNAWTGMVQAWPMPWRAAGAGVLGPRPGTPHQQAMFAAPSPAAPYGYSATLPGYGVTPPVSGVLSGYGHPGASSSTATHQPWDMASLQATLHSASASPSCSGSAPEWYLDSGAAAHMTSSPGPTNQGGDSPM